jgi:formylmethanofuran dehydrogenase subunit E
MKDHPLLIAAGRFHGHIGPFLAIGLRMGGIANQALGRDPMEMKASVAVEPRPPRSCVLDGIQYSTGCTMGKGNIMFKPSPVEVSATFHMGQKSVEIKVKQALLERIESELDGKPEKAVIDYAFGIMDTPRDEIFEVS